MSGTVSGTLDTEIVLGTASSYADPLTIAGSVNVNAGMAAIDAMTQWIIVNDGAIAGNGGYGIMLNAGGSIDNAGLISGTQDGIFGSGRGTASLDLINSGTIEGGNVGVLMVNAQDSLRNAAGALISGGSIGVRFTGFGTDNSTLINQGTIEGFGSIGVALSEAAANNAASGLIESNATAVSLDILSEFTNYGTIIGNIGVLGGSSDGTIINAGTIEGTGGTAVSFLSGSANVLEFLPGGTVEGEALGGNNATLMFGGGLIEGTIGGLGSSILNFGSIELTPGAEWDFSGTSSISATSGFDNAGTIVEHAADALTISAPITGTGMIEVDSSTLFIGNSVGAGQTIALNGQGSTLVLAKPGLFMGTIAGFDGSDMIEIEGAGSAATVTGSMSGNVLNISGGIAPTSITFATAPGTVYLVPLVMGTTKAYEIVAPCFAAGTRILTPDGPVPVEALREGDPVINHRGEAKPSIWHGARRIDCRRHARPEAVWPVVVEAGAFGPGLPARDLYLSPDHALYVERALIPVKHLINGVSVRQVAAKSVTYHHIELAAHDVIWAESLPAETYLECGNRQQFGQGKSIALQPDFTPLHWDAARACAPLVATGEPLARARAALHASLLARGCRPEVPGIVTVTADGRKLGPAGRVGNRYRFTLPDGARRLTIGSNAAVAADTDPRSEDRRRLGIALARITMNGTAMAPDDLRLGAGFHPAEARGKGWFRWTDGAAQLDVEGAGTLGFTVTGQQPVWRMPAAHRMAAG
jgi:hypothetical protein